MDPNSRKRASTSGEHRLELKSDSEKLVERTKREVLEAEEVADEVAEATESLSHSVNKVIKILWLVLGRLSGNAKRHDSAIAWAKILTLACIPNAIAISVLIYRHEKQSDLANERNVSIHAEIKSSHAEMKATRALMARSQKQVEKIDRAVKEDAEREESESKIEIKPSRRPGGAVVRILPPRRGRTKARSKSSEAVEIPINLKQARPAH